MLASQCYECHSATAAEVKGQLRLDSRPAIRLGGESGPAVVPGKPGESLLLTAIRHESFEMPPKKKLDDTVIKDFEKWIRLGAADPRNRPPTASDAAALNWDATIATRKDWWSLKPVRDPDIPERSAGGWSRHPVDAFIARKLQESGLHPAEPADAHTLARRLALILTGLPCGSGTTNTFLQKWKINHETAWEWLVDTLLSSPHFGERWARHWMDVVRFTETHGNEWNYEVHYAWQYRDYLVRAFNSDLPYNQFVREHLAGDLMETPRLNPEHGFNESVIGTAFYRFGEVNHDDCIELTSIGYDIIANQIDTVTKAFQGATIACARCHDHKIDAYSTGDYHSMLGILKSSRYVSHALEPIDINRPRITKLETLKVQIRDTLGEIWKQDVQSAAAHLMAAQAVRREILSIRADDDEALKTARNKVLENLAPLIRQWYDAVSAESYPMEHPIHVWRRLSERAPGKSVADAWKKIAAVYRKEHTARRKDNSANFSLLFDLRENAGSWTLSGHGAATGRSQTGELAPASEGNRIATGILPPGIHTHRLSQNIGGAIRSPVMHPTTSHVSIRVLGGERAAVRIVSNNCQFNYVNYKVLLSDKASWITFKPPADRKLMRPYIEAVTKFYNPKFPDQLATIGGAPANDRIPWSEASENPRSFFGVTHVVQHDGESPPAEDIGFMLRLFNDHILPDSDSDVARQFARVLSSALTRWTDHCSSEDDRTWIDWLIRNDLVTNNTSADDTLLSLVDQYRQVESELRRPRIVPGIEDVDDGFDQPLLVRGNPSEFGAPVPRQFVGVLKPDANRYTFGSGRRQLAEDYVSSDNPFTSRVMANRTWHHLFGSGLTRTTDDLGRLGDEPSHPELLDHLATRFVASGWSVKDLIRYIVTSRTFRLRNGMTELTRETDPLNRLLHHFPVRRLEAEAIRDAILAASGQLDHSIGGESIYPYRDKSNADRRLFVGPLDGHGRRSLYIKTNLMEPTRFLSTFNTPGGKVTEGQRESSNVPAQALALLNDPFVHQQGRKWAEQLVADSELSIEKRIKEMFLTALARPARKEELGEFRSLGHELMFLHNIKSDSLMTSVPIWTDMAHVIFNLKEFIYIP